MAEPASTAPTLSLTARLVIGLTGLLIVGGVALSFAAFSYGKAAAREAFDRLLVGAAQDIAASITVVDGAPVVDIASLNMYSRQQPGRAFAVLILMFSLAGLPPALVITAECDVLHDEGRAYAAALTGAGNHVHAVQHDDQIHGFVSMIGQMDSAMKAIEQTAQFLDEQGLI